MSISPRENRTVAKMVPQIEFNMNACLGGWECGKCLRACSPHVFRCFTDGPEGKASVSKDWVPIATYLSLCTGCMKCVSACPKADEGAIRVTFVPRRLPRK